MLDDYHRNSMYNLISPKLNKSPFTFRNNEQVNTKDNAYVTMPIRREQLQSYVIENEMISMLFSKFTVENDLRMDSNL